MVGACCCLLSNLLSLEWSLTCAPFATGKHEWRPPSPEARSKQQGKNKLTQHFVVDGWMGFEAKHVDESIRTDTQRLLETITAELYAFQLVGGKEVHPVRAVRVVRLFVRARCTFLSVSLCGTHENAQSCNLCLALGASQHPCGGGSN